jgi:hypothetical protein
VTEHRELGPQLTADGWRSLGNDIHWFSHPSRLSVEVSECKWGECSGIPAFPGEPESGLVDGYLSGWRRWDGLGNPVWPASVGEDYQLVWVASWAKALEIAIECRRRILAEKAPIGERKQLNFDDFLEAKK